MISIIIPANNEEKYIGPCLEALVAQETAHVAEAIVSANACVDATVDLAQGYTDRFRKRGWRLVVLDAPDGGKPGALNRADAVATGDVRVYLDADVVMSPLLLEQLADALDRPVPVYASGRMTVSRAESWVTRAYGRIWTRLPFMADGVPGAGLFAVNAAGRARWGAFPRIISDDTFVRLLFAPAERIGVAAPYSWPLVEGFTALVRVRRRQDAGVAEVTRLYPDLLANADGTLHGPASIAGLALRDPIGFGVYVLVRLMAGRGQGADWDRGR